MKYQKDYQNKKAEISRARSDALVLQNSFAPKSFNDKKNLDSIPEGSSVQCENEVNIDNDEEICNNNHEFDDNLQCEDDVDDGSNVDMEEIQDELNDENDDMISDNMISNGPHEYHEPGQVQIPQSDLLQSNVNNMVEVFVDEDLEEKLDEIPMVAI